MRVRGRHVRNLSLQQPGVSSRTSLRFGFAYFVVAALSIAPLSAQDSLPVSELDNGRAPVGALTLGVGHNMDAGPTLSGSFKHGAFLGQSQSIDLGFRLSEDEQAYDLMLRNDGVGDGNPQFAFTLSHTETDLQSTLGLKTLKTVVKPSLVFALSDAQAEIGLVLGRDEVTDAATAPAVLRQDEGGRDLRGVFADYTMSRPSLLLGFSGQLMSSDNDLRYAKLEGQLRYAFDERRSGFAIELQTTAGVIAVEQGQTTVNDRFFPASGALRGFEANGFGPSLGSVQVGGTRYVAVSLDARRTGLFDAMPEVSVGGFVDVGSVWGLDDNDSADRSIVDASAKLRGALGLTVSRDFGGSRVELVLAHPFRHEEIDRLQEVQINFVSKF